MKVFARLFQKAAGAWGSAPRRARRREISQTLFSFVKQICSSLQHFAQKERKRFAYFTPQQFLAIS